MSTNIKAVILDVDGVIIGGKTGYNSPHPHPDVIKTLKQIQNKGIPISLCTARPHFSISKEIKEANLDNLHITDGGGVIIDPINNLIVKQNIINNDKAIEVLKVFLDKGVYTEFYTVDNYFIQESQAGDIIEKHAYAIQSSPRKVKSLLEEVKNKKITKIIIIAINEGDKKKLEKLFDQFQGDLELSWATLPVILPLQFGIITAPGISKKEGAIEISKSLNVPFENILGVGDSISDWQFIEMCGFGVAMGNAQQELKDKVLTKGKDKSFIAPSVDENGILEAFKFFGLL